MSNDFYPIDHPVGGSVPSPGEVVPRRRPRRRRSIGLAVAAFALVAGGTAGGIALGNLGSGEHAPGFSSETSQSFTGGQEAPNDPEQPAPSPTTRHGGEGDDAD